MLDRTMFVKELRALADRFNRQVSEEMARRYYEDLKHLDTQDFLTAARVIYRNDTFWPAPARFEQVIGVDGKSLAEAAWEATLDEATRGDARPWSEYTPAHAAALRAVGGNAAIGRTNQDRLTFVKREFIQAFQQHRDRADRPQLEAPEPLEIAGLA